MRTRTFSKMTFAALQPGLALANHIDVDGVGDREAESRGFAASFSSLPTRFDTCANDDAGDSGRGGCVGRWNIANSGGSRWVTMCTIFENRGAMMGASNPHPHGQIWATDIFRTSPRRS